MRILNGTPKEPGIAMAVAVVVDSKNGISSFPEGVMKQGMKALRMGLPAAEHAEVIVICDLLQIGSAVRLPGIRVAGIICEGNDEPVLPLSVPCITGVTDASRSVNSDDFLILDAEAGDVYIDPDVQTIIRYQNALTPEPLSRVFLESTHIPAQSQDGRTVTVAADVSTMDETELAISQGADALLVRFAQMLNGADGDSEAEVELIELLCGMAGGKPLILLISDPGEDVLAIARRLSHHETITFIEPDDAPVVLDAESIVSAVRAGDERVVVRAPDVTAAKDIIRSTRLDTMEDD